MVKQDKLLLLRDKPVYLQGFFYFHKPKKGLKHLHFRVSKVARMDKRFGKLRVTSSLPIKEGQPYIVKPPKKGLTKYLFVDSKGLLGGKGVIGKLVKSKIYSWWVFIPFKWRRKG